MAAPALRSLAEFLGEIPDFRKARGQRYPLSCYLAIAIAARLAGYRGVTAMGEFAALLDQDQLCAVGAFWSPSRKRYTAPATSTFRYILTSLPPETLDRVLQDWTAQHLGEGTPVAMDGKEVRGASKALPEDRRRMLVAAVEHGSGLVLGQVQVGDTTNEITAVRELAEILDLRNRTVTLDAMHVQQETARCLIDRCRARLSGHRRQEQPGNPPGGPAGHRLEHGAHLAGTMAEGAWPHRATPVRGGGRQRPGVGRLCRSLWTPAGVARGAGTSCLEPRNQQHGNRLVSHLIEPPGGRTPATARPHSPALGDREPAPLRARLHLRRRSLPGEDPPPPAQSRLPHQRRHLHRASQFLPVHARGEPVLCRPTASGPRYDPDPHAELIPQRPEPPIRARSRRSGLSPSEIPDWTGPIPPSGSRIFLTTHHLTPLSAPASPQPTRNPPDQPARLRLLRRPLHNSGRTQGRSNAVTTFATGCYPVTAESEEIVRQ